MCDECDRSPGHALQQAGEVFLLQMIAVELPDLILRQHDLSLHGHCESCFMDPAQNLLYKHIYTSLPDRKSSSLITLH